MKKAIEKLVFLFNKVVQDLNPKNYVWGFSMQDNAVVDGHRAMFARTEPVSNDERQMQWRARMLGNEAHVNPDEHFYRIVQDLTDCVARTQGLRHTYRYGDPSMQARLMAVEDRVRSAIDMLYVVRPDEENFFGEEQEESIPPQPGYVHPADRAVALVHAQAGDQS